MAHILIVDDDAEVLGTVWRALSRDGHEVVLAESVSQARRQIEKQSPDMIVLDIMMPEEDGLSFCRELRQQRQFDRIPILFLSAKWRSDDIVLGLDAGGDDYLTKPFALNELNARVRALLRRVPSTRESEDVLEVGDLMLDPKSFQVSTAEANNIQLTSTEYRLLEYLIATPDQVHSVHDLLDKVWQYPAGTGDPDLVRAHIRNLRAKIEPDTRKPIYIHTVHGLGYMVRG